MSAPNQPVVVIPNSWAGPSPDDHVIADPLNKLRAKYFYADSTLSLEFDLYAARRATEPGWADRLEGADWAATLLMNSQIESWDVDAAMSGRATVDSALAQVPAGLDLAIADLANPALRTALYTLFQAMRVDRISVAKATKVLCLKRPQLVPMIDDYVLSGLYYYRDRPAFSTDPAAFAADVLNAVGCFRRLMLWDHGDGRTNLDGLTALAAAFSEEVSAYLTARGVPGPHPHMTPVRVLDNLLWFEQKGYENFGWLWDEANRRVYNPNA